MSRLSILLIQRYLQKERFFESDIKIESMEWTQELSVDSNSKFLYLSQPFCPIISKLL